MFFLNRISTRLVSVLCPDSTISAKGMVTNYREGGRYKTVGGTCEVLPLQTGGGGRKSFSHAEGGAQQVLG